MPSTVSSSFSSSVSLCRSSSAMPSVSAMHSFRLGVLGPVTQSSTQSTRPFSSSHAAKSSQRASASPFAVGEWKEKKAQSSLASQPSRQSAAEGTDSTVLMALVQALPRVKRLQSEVRDDESSCCWPRVRAASPRVRARHSFIAAEGIWKHILGVSFVRSSMVKVKGGVFITRGRSDARA